MEVSTNENEAPSTASKTAPTSNASQAQISQKTWEISNFMQGKLKRFEN